MILRNELRVIRLLAVVIVIISHLSSAQSDTVYFNKIDVECAKSNASFYRLFEIQDSIIKVENYYMNHKLQGAGMVRNDSGMIQKLTFVGDLEEALIGEWYSYKKNGKLSFQVNYTPFDPLYGVGFEKINLLDSTDTIAADIKNLVFYTSYFQWRTDYGFTLENDDYHGTWTRINKKSGEIIKQAHNYKNELNGVKTNHYRSGGVRLESYYKDDVLHGEKKRYNRKGRLVEGKVYEDGTLVETWRYHKPKKKG